MKKEVYVKNDKSEGENYWLEKGDEFMSLDDAPREAQFGKYKNYSLQIQQDDKQFFIRLTQGQYKRLKNLGNINLKKFVATSYTNEHGTHVGLDEA